MPDREASSRNYLKGALRRSLPGYPLQRTIDAGPPAPPAPGEAARQRAIELRIKSILGHYIPDNPAYNQQILFTLETLRKNNVGDMNPKADAPRLAEIVKGIHDKRPRARMHFSREHAADLHTLLEKYQDMTGKRQSEFPYMEIIGHRSDQKNLKAYSNDHPARPANDTEKRKATRQTLKAINGLLDEVCPASEEFNDIRQMIVEDVLQNSHPISKWIHARDDMLESSKRPNFVKPADEYYNAGSWAQDVAFSIRYKIVRRSQPLLGSGTAKPLTPQDAIAIDKLMKSHLTASTKAAGERPAKRLRQGVEGDMRGEPAPPDLPRRPPDSIVQTALRPRRTDVKTNLHAKMWGEKCLETVKDIFPANERNTIRSRMHFLEAISANRRFILEKGLDQSAQSASLLSLSQSYHVVFKEKEPQIKLLANQIDNFHKAWTGALQRTNAARQARERRALSRGGDSSSTLRNLSASPADESGSDYSFDGMSGTDAPRQAVLAREPATNRLQGLKRKRSEELTRPGSPPNVRAATSSQRYMSPDWPSSDNSSESDYSFDDLPDIKRPSLPRIAPTQSENRPRNLKRKREEERSRSGSPSNTDDSSSESDHSFDGMTDSESSNARSASPLPEIGRERDRSSDRLGRGGLD